MKDQAESETPPHPPLILVLGMHRSGTSLLGSLLNSIGIPLPGELITGDIHNPEGYFERCDITEQHETLLLELGHWWPSQQGVLDLPLTWLSHPATAACAVRIRRALQEESARQPGPWAIKDPRSSLLLPLWRHVCAELGLPLRLALSLRDPSEVSASLLRRDRKPAGMTPWRTQQLWWRHYSQVILESHGLPLQVVHYSRWFEGSSAASEQLRRLARFCGAAPPSAEQERQALARIRPEHRRSLHSRLRLIPTHPQLRQLEKRLMDLTASPEERTDLEAWLSHSQQPIVLPLSERRHGHHPLEQPEPLTPGSHPLAAAALALHGQHQVRAHRQLQHWNQQHHLSAMDLSQVRLAADDAFPLLNEGETSRADLCGRTATADRFALLCWGESWIDWQIQAWLQHVPLPLEPCRCELLDLSEAPSEPPPEQPGEVSGQDMRTQAAWIGLHFQDVSISNGAGQLERLARMDAVFDPDPDRVHLLRRLGIRAFPLVRGSSAANGWLRPSTDSAAIARCLGLPDPLALNPGALPFAVMALGSGGPDWERQLAPPCWCVPGFDGLHIADQEDARLLAAWLDRCQRSGFQLLRFESSPAEQRLQGFQSLCHPEPAPPGWLPVQFFQRPLALPAVEEELAWRCEGCPEPPPCHTPVPRAHCLWERRSGPAAAAVCISLHNYADRIEAALDSVHRQCLEALELIVVDDASSDGGEEIVRCWLERHGGRFARALLLRHAVNGGLAAARNTAFTATEAPWVFVLDADNLLLPHAVRDCLRVAQAAPPTAAVVHSLVEVVRDEGSGLEEPALMSPLSWQNHHFRVGNYLDAMALVRVAAWREVGGYAHIPGGWEDFDFWCLLIGAGRHGVLCPQRLAIYQRHGDSMLSSTNRHIRRISRLLQARHSWLELPMARADV
jgi:hypothetical protein